MENKEYLTEERYQKVNKFFKAFYLVLAFVGIGMIISGIILLIKNSSVDYFSTGKLTAFILLVVGVPLTGMSIADWFRHTFVRNITAYYVQQQMPIAQENIEKMAPSVGKAAGTVSKEIAKGIKEGMDEKE